VIKGLQGNKEVPDNASRLTARLRCDSQNLAEGE
jgi:hypothetical protein